MNEQQTSPVAAPSASSFMTRATNVFAAPSELYGEVATVPVQSTSWVLPFLFSIILVIVATYAVYNNPSLRQQIWDMQEMAMKKQVEKGNMTQGQMEQRLDQMQNSGPAMFMVFGAGLGSIGLAFVVFGSTLALWLIVKLAYKSPAGYSKILEIFGLSMMIGIVGSIITLVTMNLMNSMYATPGPALAMVGSFDPMNTTHKLLAALNVFTIWQVVVLGVGIAKVSGKSLGTGIGLTLALWAVWTVGSTLLGIGR
jgi:Yip1-like protein